MLMSDLSVWSHATRLWAQATHVWSAVPLQCWSRWQAQSWLAVIVVFTLCSLACIVSMLSDGFCFTLHGRTAFKQGWCTFSKHSCSNVSRLAVSSCTSESVHKGFQQWHLDEKCASWWHVGQTTKAARETSWQDDSSGVDATRPDSLPARTKHVTMTHACLLFLTVKKWSPIFCQWGDFVQVCRTHTFGTRCYAHIVLHLYKLTVLVPDDTMNSSSTTQFGVHTVHHEVCTLAATAKRSLSPLGPVQVAFTCSNNQRANWLFGYVVPVYKSMFVEGHT